MRALPPAMKDPLLSALVGKLPEPGKPFSAAERDAWFDMMRKAVDVAYGPVEAPSGSYENRRSLNGTGMSDPAHERIGEIKKPVPVASRFLIAPDGAATNEAGVPVDPSEIPSGSVIDDYRPQPIDPEYNPIMWKTLGSVKLQIPPGVRLREASGPWPGRGKAMTEATT